MNVLAISARRIKSVFVQTNFNHVSTRCIRGDGMGKTEPIAESVEVVVKNESQNEDMPISDMCNPYIKDKPQCVLCKYNVKLDYKNAQLLSQFLSQFTGQVYGKHVTGLCKEQQKRLLKAVRISQQAGFLPYHYKDIQFLKDPKLFDIGHVGKKI